MKVFQIRNLLFISVLAFFYGCAFRNYGLIDVQDKSQFKVTQLKPVISDSIKSVHFKAQVDLYGKYFGGLLFLKKTKNDNYRLIMTTETGLQIFDLELFQDSMIVHACIHYLNKESVLKTIESDFRLALMDDIENEQYEMLSDKGNLYTVFKNRQQKKLTYYYIENKTGYLTRIERASPWFKKVTVEMSDFDDERAKNIQFIHHNVRLKIKLRVLKND